MQTVLYKMNMLIDNYTESKIELNRLCRPYSTDKTLELLKIY